MDHIETPWHLKIIQGVAGAVLIGGGSLIVGNTMSNVRQDTQIENLLDLKEDIRALDETMDHTREELSRLNQKLEDMEELND